MSPSPDTPAAPAPRPARTRRQRALRWAWVSTLVLALMIGGLLAWVLQSTQGGQWALGQVPGLSVLNPQGSFTGSQWSADEVRWQGESGVLVLRQVSLGGLAWHWTAVPGAQIGLRVADARAATVQWTSQPGRPPSPPPTDVGIPVALSVTRLAVPELDLDGVRLTGLAGALDAGPNEHHLQLQQLQDGRAVYSGDLRLGTRGTLPLQARAQARSLATAEPAWQAEATAEGPLQDLRSRLTLRGAASGNRPAPSVDLSAQLHPLATWPLGALALQTRALDLSALHAGWPGTQLDAQVQLAARQGSTPVSGQLSLKNARPGALDQGALPLASLDASVALHWASDTALAPDSLRLTSLSARLAGGAGVQAELAWSGDRAEGRWQLQQLRPEALNTGWPAMHLSGEANGVLSGLPTLTGWLTGAAPLDPARLRGSVQGDWQGQLGGLVASSAPQAVALGLQLEADATQIQLQRLEARAGEARLSARGHLSPHAGQAWPVALQLDWQQWDPARWVPGPADAPWRRGPHRLQGQLRLDGQFDPARWQARQGLERLGAWRGQVLAELAPSTLAGVALQGRLQWQQAVASSGELQLDAAGNQVQARWQGELPQPSGELQLSAPALAALAPVIRLVDPTWAPQGGRLDARLARPASDAPWQLQASTEALRLPDWQLAQGRLELSAGRQAAAPLTGSLQLQAWSAGALRLDQASATLSGTLADHRYSLRAQTPARPGVLIEQALGTQGGTGTELQLDGQGHWQGAGSGLARWSTTLEQLRLRGRAAQGTDWVAARGVQAELQLDAQGRPALARLSPGELVLPETRLRWQAAQATWPADGGTPVWQLDAQLDPFRLAPVLARAQPELGWRGDLRLAGSLQLRRAREFSADVVFERLDGDLAMVDDVRDPRSPVQALALSDLRLGLSAHQGVWHFTQALAGRALGELSGVATLRTAAERSWPDAAASLDGVVQMRVANLGAWGAWVPPGWRLGGAMQLTAGFGGRFGAPELTGRLSAQQVSARHPLLGVQVSDGVVEVKLDGQHAHIEQFSLRGGDGQLQLSGDASLGAAPALRLAARADRFLVLGRVDRRLIASGSATLDLSPSRWVADGQFQVDEGLFDLSRGDAPSLDSDVVFASSEAPQAQARPARPARPLQLKARLDLGQRLQVKGRGIDGLLRGELVATVNNERVALNGTVRMQDGHYAAYGQQLDIERGVLTFTGPVDDPRLDVFAVRPNLDVKVGVQVTGSALNPRVRLASEPEMSDAYKLSWLMLGREPSGLGEADTALLQRAAMALLAGEGEAPSDAVLKTLGITDFSVRQTTDSNDVRQTVVSLGRQLSRRWYVGYERGINATNGTWQLIYRIAQRFTLRAQSGDDNAVDLIWSWRWP